MLLNPKNLKAAFSLGEKIIELGTGIEDNKDFFFLKSQFDGDGIGTYITLDKKDKKDEKDYLFIGFNPLMPAENFVSIAIKNEYLIKRKINLVKNQNNFDEVWVYFPLFGDTEEKAEDNIAQLLSSETDEEQINNFRNLVSTRLKEIGVL